MFSFFTNNDRLEWDRPTSVPGQWLSSIEKIGQQTNFSYNLVKWRTAKGDFIKKRFLRIPNLFCKGSAFDQFHHEQSVKISVSRKTSFSFQFLWRKVGQNCLSWLYPQFFSESIRHKLVPDFLFRIPLELTWVIRKLYWRFRVYLAFFCRITACSTISGTLPDKSWRSPCQGPVVD